MAGENPEIALRRLLGLTGALCLLSAMTGARVAADVTQANIGYSSLFPLTYTSNQGLLLLGVLSYQQSDGTSFIAAGTQSYHYANLVPVGTGSAFTFSLAVNAGSEVYHESASSNLPPGMPTTEDRLAAIGPIALVATQSSTVATASGYLRLTENANPANVAKFSYFVAPVGSLVPFQINYTRKDGGTWDATAVGSSFSYQMSGNLDVAHALPPGDADGNGRVDLADLLTVARNFGDKNASWSAGDFDGSGTVDFPDLMLVARHFGFTMPYAQSAAAAGFSAAAPVPEPSALCLAMIGATALPRRRLRAK